MGVDDFGTVQFRYTSYMLLTQPVLLRYKRVDHFGTVFGPLRYIMKSDCKERLSMVFVWEIAVCLIDTQLHIISGERTANCQIPSAPCYASTQSDHSAIITPPSLYAADTATDNDKRFLWLWMHNKLLITEVQAVIVRGKRVKQRVMYPRRLSDRRQLTSITVNGWPLAR